MQARIELQPAGRSRGQAVFESAIFLPLMLVCMLGIIYFSQYGVLQIRAVQAVRYAALVTNGSSAGSPYSIESAYAELSRIGSGTTSYPLSDFSCSGTGKADKSAEDALYQKEALPSGTSAPTAPSYFKADTTPSGSCQAYAMRLSTNSTDAANSYFIAQYTSLSAGKSAPGFLASSGIGQVNAGMAYPLSVGGAALMYCSPNFAWQMAQSLGPFSTSSEQLASYGNYPQPASSPTVPPNC